MLRIKQPSYFTANQKLKEKAHFNIQVLVYISFKILCYIHLDRHIHERFQTIWTRNIPVIYTLGLTVLDDVIIGSDSSFHLRFHDMQPLTLSVSVLSTFDIYLPFNPSQIASIMTKFAYATNSEGNPCMLFVFSGIHVIHIITNNMNTHTD